MVASLNYVPSGSGSGRARWAEPDSQLDRRDDALFQELHDGQTYLNNTTGFATTLPVANGTGAKFRLFIAATVSSGSHTIVTASASDVYKGFAHLFGDDAAALGGFSTTTGVTITMDGSTRGGFAGDIVELEDVATGVWSVRMYGHATGTEATPFS
jgi:hypothetical protein